MTIVAAWREEGAGLRAVWRAVGAACEQLEGRWKPPAELQATSLDRSPHGMLHGPWPPPPPLRTICGVAPQRLGALFGQAEDAHRAQHHEDRHRHQQHRCGRRAGAGGIRVRERRARMRQGWSDVQGPCERSSTPPHCPAAHRPCGRASCRRPWGWWRAGRRGRRGCQTWRATGGVRLSARGNR